MATKMILTGNVNLMNVTDPAVPFSLVQAEFRVADIVFCNLECCLYRALGGHAVEHEGFFADPVVAYTVPSPVLTRHSSRSLPVNGQTTRG